jgi:hypothetical protein
MIQGEKRERGGVKSRACKKERSNRINKNDTSCKEKKEPDLLDL